MAYANGIISAPVSIYDIQRAIGVSSKDLGTLCKSNNINMWAKWKPVSKPIIDIMSQLNSDKTWKTDAQLGTAAWWRAALGDYGLTFPSFEILTAETSMETALTNMLASINGGLNGWKYLRPNGGTTSQYRQTDFNRYNHNAPNPIIRFSCLDSVTSAENTKWEISAQFISVDFDIPISTRDYLVPTDVTNFMLYPGIAIFKKSNGNYIPMAWTTGGVWEGAGIKYAGTPDGVISRGTTDVGARFTSGQTYYMIPVYFTCQLPQNMPGYSAQVQSGGNKVIPVPFVDFDSFTCHIAATWQTIGYPDITNHTVQSGQGATLGFYYTDFTMDSRGDYYDGTSGATKIMTIGIVNETWDGSMTPSSSMYAYWNDNVSFVLGRDEIITVASIPNTIQDRLTLDLSHSWKVIMNVDGDITEHALRTVVTPTL